jgi:ferredoxin
MRHRINSETCKKCGSCGEVCPNGIIEQAGSEEVKFRPERLDLCVTPIGLIPPAVKKNKDLCQMFQIPEGNEVLASMIVGYPKVSFRRGIKWELARVNWI